MEQNEDIEMQLWEYIDGSCAINDMQRISILIERDALWKAKYEELAALNGNLSRSIELEQPSMRFTANVMDAVTATHVAPATKKYINKSIIRAIAAAFIIMLTTMLGYAFANSKGSSSSLLQGIKGADLSAFFNSPAFNTVIMLNVVIALVLFDAILRRKQAHHAN